MRPFGSAFGLLGWRLRMSLAGYRMRLRGLASLLMVFGGLGIAIGYSIVHRLGDRFAPEDERASGPPTG